MELLIASDHAGYDLKTSLTAWLRQQGHQVEDLGPASADRVDYPDNAHPLAQRIEAGEPKVGILLCGSGNGVCMTANKYPHVRAALVWNAELAGLARAHNDANVLCLPARYLDEQEARLIVTTFLQTAFEGGRHAPRVQKIQPA